MHKARFLHRVLLQVRSHVVQMSNNVQEIYRGKTAHMSKQQRDEAEHLRKKEKLDKALLLYTQSIIKAPTTGKNMCYSLSVEESAPNTKCITL